MSKIISYVVFERGYEYNDETYNSLESPGGDPKRVVFSKEEAIKLVTELSRDSFKGLCIGHYSYELSDLVDTDLLKSVFETNKWKWDEDEVTIPEKATNEQLDEVIGMIDLKFFDYQEVELDMSSLRNLRIDSINS